MNTDQNQNNNTPSSHPSVLLPDASFLLFGDFARVGFDLVITNPAGETFVVHDYFAFNPPPNLVLENGTGLSPEMVAAFLQLPYEDVMFAGEANSAAARVEIGSVWIVFGDVKVRRMGANGQVEETALKKGDVLYKNDILITGDRAFIKAKMLDDTRFHLGKNGRAALTDYEFNEQGKLGKFEASVQVGGFHYRSGKIGEMLADQNRSHSTIRTPSAIIGIRGSELDGTVDPSGQTIIVHKSGYLVISDINNQSEVILQATGNTAVIVLNGTPSFTAEPTPQQVETLQGTLPPPDTGDDLNGEDPTEEESAQEETTDTTEDAGEEGVVDEASEEISDETGEVSEEESEDSEESEESSEEDTEEPLQDDAGEETPGNEDPGVDENTAPEGDSTTAFATNDGDVFVQTQDPDGTGTDDTPQNTSSESGDGVQPGSSGNNNTGQEELPPPNNPPVARTDTLDVQEGATLTGLGSVLLANDSDADISNSLRIIAVNSSATQGTVVFTPATGAISYTADAASHNALGAGQVATDSFQYTITDGAGGTATALVTVNISGLNDPPTAVPDSYATTEDQLLTVTSGNGLLQNDSDPDASDVLTLVGAETTSADGAVVAIQADGSFVFTPSSSAVLNALAPGQTFDATFNYTISDGQGGSASATATITVSGVNDNPVIMGQSYTIDEDTPTSVNLLANATDVDNGDSLSLVSATATTPGLTVILDNQPAGTITLMPDAELQALGAGDSQVREVSYTVVDTFGGSAQGVAVITITGVNDAPVAEPDQLTVSEDSEPLVIDLLANDSDIENQALSLVSISPVDAVGTLLVGGDGLVRYEVASAFQALAAGETATELFSYLVADEDGATSAANVTVTVTGANDAPLFESASFSASENSGVVEFDLNPLVSDVDTPDVLVLTAQSISSDVLDIGLVDISLGTNGVLSLNTDTMPSLADGEVATLTIVGLVDDQSGEANATGTGTVTITITGINDPPEPVNNEAPSVQGGGPVVVDITQFDPEGDITLVSIVSPVTRGTLTVDPLGKQVTFDPGTDFDSLAQGETAGESFSYLVADDGTGTTATHTLTFQVEGINDAPVAAPDVLTLPASTTPSDLEPLLLGNDLDVDNGASLSITAVDTQNTIGTVTLGSVFYDPSGKFDYLNAGEFATDSFGYTVTDEFGASSPGIATITIEGVNDAPRIVGTLADLDIFEKSPANLVLDFSVFDEVDNGDSLVFSISGLPAGLAFDGIDSLTGTPSNSDVGSYTVTAIATDQVGQTASLDFNLTVINVNDAPLATDDTFVTDEDVALSGNLLTNDSDPDGDQLEVDTTPVAAPLFGSLTLQANGDFVYTPNVGFAGTDSFSYSVHDGNGGSANATVNLTVTAIPDPPQAVDDAYSVLETGPALQSDVLANDSDPDGDLLTVVAVSGGSLGTPFLLPSGALASLDAQGNFVYDPNGAFSYLGGQATATDTLTYTISDGASTASATITLTISGVDLVLVTTGLSTDWNDAAAWDGNIVPRQADAVEIRHEIIAGTGVNVADDILVLGNAGDLTLAGTATLDVARNLFVDNGSVLALTTSGSMTIGGDLVNDGSVSWSGGAIGAATTTNNGVLTNTSTAANLLEGNFVNFGSALFLAQLTGNGDLVNKSGGDLVLEARSNNAYEKQLINEAGGVTTLEGGGPGFDFNFATSIINAGELLLSETSSAGGSVDLVFTSGSLSNQATGVVRSTGTELGRSINGDFSNSGLLDVAYDLLLQNTFFTTDEGDIHVAGGTTLDIDGATVIVGSGTTLSGTGAIQLTGSTGLNLASDFVLDSGPSVDFAGAVNVGSGAGATFTNAGQLGLLGSNDVFAVDVVNTGTMTAFGRGDTGHALATFDGGLVNSGTLVLDSLSSLNAQVLLSAGTLVNQSGGVIQSVNPGTRVISGTLTNAGLIDVDSALTIENVGRVFDQTNGTVDVSNNADLTVNGGTTRIGADTLFVGTTGDDDQVVLAGNHTLALASTYTHNTDVNLDFGGAVTVTGADWVNASPLLLHSGNDSFQVSFTNNDLVQVKGGTNGAHANLTFENGLVNTGTLVLDSISSFNATVTLTGGILDNQASGTITSVNPGGRTLVATVLNDGLINVGANSPLTITNTGRVFDTTTGEIDVSADADLVINGGTSRIGSGSIFYGGPGDSDQVVFAGTQVLELASNYTHVTQANLNFDGAVTVTGPGAWVNEAPLLLHGGNDTFNVAFDNNNTLLVTGGVNGAHANLTFDQGLLNAGLLKLDSTSSFNSAVSVNGSGLTNSGTLQSINPGGRTVDAELTNTGLIDVDSALTIENVGRVFDQTNGTVDVSNNADLTVNGGTTRIGADTLFVGTTGDDDQVVLAGNHTLALASTYTHNTDVNLDFGGAVTVTGADWVNASPLLLHSGNDSFQVSFTNNDLVQVKGGTNGAHANLTFENGLVNTGTLVLDSISSFNATVTLTGGILDNQASGTITSVNPGGRTLVATVLNDGVINVGANSPLTITNAGRVFDTTTGEIDVSADADLIINGGTTRIGSGSIFYGGPGDSDQVVFAGTQVLELASNYTHVTQANLNFDGAVTVTGPGAWVNEAPLLLHGGNDTFNVAFDNNNTLLVTGGVNGAHANLTFDQGLLNAGLLKLDSTSSFNSAVSVNGSGLTNSGTLQSINPGGRTVDAELTNTGLIDVDSDLLVLNPARTFDQQAGTVDLSAGHSLTIDGGETLLGGGSVFTGTIGDSDRLVFAGTHAIELVTDYIHGTDVYFDFAGAVDVNGASWTNNAPLTLYGANDVLNVQFDNNSTLEIKGGISGSHTDVVFTNGLTNTGQLLLTSTSGFNAALTVSGSDLVNAAGGLIESENPGTRAFNANVSGEGNWVFNAATTIDGDAIFDGEVDVNQDLTITGDVTVGGVVTVAGSRNFLLSGPGVFSNLGIMAGSGTFSLAAAALVVNDGTIAPGSSIGTLTITTTSLAQSDSARTEIEIAGIGSRDTLVVSGEYEIDGTLDLNFLPGHGLVEGDSFSIISFGSSQGAAFDAVTDNLGGGLRPDIVYGANEISVTIVSVNFSTSFDNDGSDGLWDTAINWSTNALPTASDDVGINGFSVVHQSGTTAINSLTLQGGADLTLSGGSLTLLANSDLEAGTSVLLNGGTLIADGNLTAAGNFDFTAGTVSGVGTFVNEGSLVSSPTTKSFLLTLDNRGDLDIIGAGGTPRFDIDNNLVNSGTITLDQTSTSNLAASLTVTSGTLTNSGIILAQDTGGGMSSVYHQLSGDLVNTAAGTIDIQAPLRYLGGNLDLTDGNLVVAAGKEFFVDGVSLDVGTSSNWSGPGTLRFGGASTLNVVTDFTLAAGAPGVDLSTTTLTVNGPGHLIVGAGQSIGLTSDAILAPLEIAGTVTVDNSSLSNVIDTVVSNTGELKLQGLGFDDGILTVNNGFTNAGNLVFDQVGTSNDFSRLTLGSGQILNEGVLLAQDTAGGMTSEFHRLLGDFANGSTGTVDINSRFRFDSGSVDLSAGTLDVAAGAVLSLNNSTVTFDSPLALAGTGTVQVDGSSTFNLAGDLTLSAGGPQFNLNPGNVTINGPGHLIVGAGQSIGLTSDAILAPLEIAGTVTVDNSSLSNVIDTVVSNTGELKLQGLGFDDGILTVNNGFTNAGNLVFDQVGTSNDFSRLTLGSGQILNEGVLLAQDTAGGMTSEFHRLLGDFANGSTGTVDINSRFRFDSGSVDLSAGTLDVAAGAVLSLNNSTVTFDSPLALAGTGTVQVDGSSTFNLAGDLTLSAGGPQFNLNPGNVTINGPGHLIVGAGQSIGLTSDAILAPLEIAGTVTVDNSSLSNVIDTVVSNTGELKLQGLGFDDGILTVNNGFTNAGNLVFDQVGTSNDFSRLTLGSGQILNEGVLLAQDTAGGMTSEFHRLLGDFANGSTGTVDINSRFRFDSGSVDLSAGTLDVAAGAVLSLNNSTVTFDSPLALAGTGTVQVDGSSTFNLAGDLTLSAGGPQFNLNPGNVTINGPGHLIVGAGQSIGLTSDAILAPLEIAGTVTVDNSSLSNVIDTVVSNTGELKLQGLGFDDGILTVNNGFTNAGNLVFDQVGTSNDFSRLTLGSGQILNEGVLLAQDTAGGMTSEFHRLLGDFANGSTGTVDINSRFRFDSGSVDLSAGTLDVAAGAVLSLNNSTVTFDSSLALAGTGTVQVDGSSTFNLAGDLTLSAGGPQFNLNPGNVTINGPGHLIVGAGQSIGLTSDAILAPLEIAGTVTVDNSSLSNVIDTVVSNTGELKLQGLGFDDGILTVNNGFTNAGNLVFDQVGTSNDFSRLTLGSGQILNEGVLLAQDTAGGMTSEFHQLLGDFVNGTNGIVDVDARLRLTGAIDLTEGAIDVGQDALLSLNNSTVTMGHSSLNVAEDGLLRFDNSTLDIGYQANWTGTGTVAVTGSTTFNIVDLFVLHESSPVLDPVGGTLIFATPSNGIFRIGEGASLTLSDDVINTNFLLDGTLGVTGTGNSLTGFMNMGNNSRIELLATSAASAQLNVTNSFANAGELVFDQLDASNNPARLILDAGESTINNGSLVALDSGGGLTSGYHRFEGNFLNGITGELDVRAQFGFFGGDINLSLGTINVGVDGVLRFDGASVTTGGFANWRGEGEVEITGNTTFVLNADLALDAESPTFDLAAGTLTINPDTTEELAIRPGAELVLVNGDEIATNLFLQGRLLATGAATNTLSGSSIFVDADGVIEVNATGASVASLQVDNGVSNAGTIVLDHLGSGSARAELDAPGGSVYNDYTGLIFARDTGGNMGGAAHLIAAELNNEGVIDVQQNLDVVFAAAGHTNNGSISIASGETLTLGGVSSTFDNTGFIEGLGTLDVSGIDTLLQTGQIAPGIGNTPGTLTVVGDFEAPSLLIDVENTSSYDTLAVTGDYQQSGTLQLSFASGHDVTPTGAVFTLVNAGSLSGASPTLVHDLAAGYDITAGTVGNSVTATISDGFEKTFLANNSSWSNLLNWLLSSAPGPGDDVLLDGVNSVFSASAVSINSLSLEDTATLHITDGLFQLAANSRTSPGTTLNLNTSAPGTGSLTLSSLIVDGNLNWANGTITGGTVTVNGDMALAIGGSTTLDAELKLNGTALIESSGGDLNGSGLLENNGVLEIQDGPNIWVDTLNDSDGVLTVLADTAAAQVDFQSSVENYGLFVVDSLAAFNANVGFEGSYFDNYGVFQVQNSGGQLTDRTIVVSSAFTNIGTVDIDHDTVVDANGAFISLQGEVDIAAGKTLEFRGSADGLLVSLDAGASFTGTGTLLFSNASVGQTMIDLFGDLVFDAPGFTLDFGAEPVTLGGSTASLTIANGSTLEIPDTTQVDSLLPVYNEGTLILSGTDVPLSGEFENRTGATLEITGSGGTKTFDFFAVNEGLINFTATGGGINTLEFGQFSLVNTFTNQGSIEVSHVSASGPSEFLGILVNEGLLSVGYNLTFAEPDLAVEHVNNGVIEIQPGWTLGFDAQNDLRNDYQGEIFGEGSLDVSAVSFLNEGVISPGSGTGGLTVIGDIEFGRTGQLDIEIGGPVQAIDYDVLDASGGTLNLRGRLNANLVNSFTPTAGNTFTIVLGSVVGSFDQVSGLDFSDSAVLEYVDLGTSLRLDTIAVTELGTPFADSITATGGIDVIVSGAGADEIVQVGADDTVYAQGGDDVIHASAAARRIDGGSGIDRLVMPENVDFVSVAGHTIEQIEILSLRDGTGTQTIQLDADAIVRMVDGLNGLAGEYDALVVIGNAGDRVEVAGDFTADGTGYLAAAGSNELFHRFVDGNGVSFYLDQHIELEVSRTDGSKVLFGGPADDALVGTAQGDELNGREGADSVLAGAGDDRVTRDLDDLGIDGGTGLDTLRFSDEVDLTGVTDFEVLDMAEGRLESLSLTLTEIIDAASTDASLDTLLGASAFDRMIIKGDAGDELTLGGENIAQISGLAQADNQSLGPFDDVDLGSPIDVFGDGDNYFSFISTSNSLQLLVHENLVDPDPVL
ncbi:MAG: Ig-like domain-containing protein [Pseudomonadota bacterium]